LQKLVETCEREIETLETEVAHAEALMATPDGASNLALIQLHAKSTKALEAKMEEWTAATLDLEALQAENQA